MPRLWIPGQKPQQRFGCVNCGSDEFPNEHEYVLHVARCVHDNPPEPPERNGFNSYIDPEQVAWVKRANREGRAMRGILGAKQRKR